MLTKVNNESACSHRTLFPGNHCKRFFVCIGADSYYTREWGYCEGGYQCTGKAGHGECRGNLKRSWYQF